MHLLPQLRELEEKYSEGFQIIGVHSAKFLAESFTSNIMQATRRYRINYPVINDRNHEIWKYYGVKAWPTTLIIDANGNVHSHIEGEVSFSELEKQILDAFHYSSENKLIVRPKLNARTSDIPKVNHGNLSFPGKITSDAISQRLFITDSSNNRILITSLDGTITDVIGRPTSGFLDGSASSALFNNPQGIANHENLVFVADTGNHAIRKIDLSTREVSTMWYSEQGKTSPWDLAYENGVLYIAMAGVHQIWDMNIRNNNTLALAGSGHEALIDGDPKEACLAQTSGLVIDQGHIYFVDSETSSIRTLDLNGDQEVHTLVGTGLFEYGDLDANGTNAKLQHPIGIALYKGNIYIADTYNNKIKVLSINSLDVSTLAGDGNSRLLDGMNTCSSFYEPSGLTIINDRIYVADTNNHAIRIIDLSSGQVDTLNLLPISNSTQ